jgi:hypothetical protein
MSSGSEKRQRGRRIHIRLTESEHDQLIQKAGELTIGDFMRASALAAKPLRVRKRQAVDADALTKLLAAIGHIGGNVNQIAAAANRNGTMQAEDINDLRAMILRMKDEVLLLLRGPSS